MGRLEFVLDFDWAAEAVIVRARTLDERRRRFVPARGLIWCFWKPLGLEAWGVGEVWSGFALIRINFVLENCEKNFRADSEKIKLRFW